MDNLSVVLVVIGPPITNTINTQLNLSVQRRTGNKLIPTHQNSQNNNNKNINNNNHNNSNNDNQNNNKNNNNNNN
jgi:hypothetical protein